MKFPNGTQVNPNGDTPVLNKATAQGQSSSPRTTPTLLAKYIAEYLQGLLGIRQAISLLSHTWWIMIIITALAAATGYMYSEYLTPRYRAWTRLQIIRDPRLAIGKSPELERGTQDVSRQAVMIQDQSLVRQASRELRQKWLSRLETKEDLLPEIKAEVVDGSNRTMVDVFAEAASKEYALDFLQVLLDKYHAARRQETVRLNEHTVRTLRTEYEQLINQIEEAQAALIRFEEKHGLSFGGTKEKSDLRYLEKLVERQNILRMEATLLDIQFPRLTKASPAILQDILDLTISSGASQGVPPSDGEPDAGTGSAGGSTGDSNDAGANARFPGKTAAEVSRMSLASGVTSWQGQRAQLENLQAKYEANLKKFKPDHPDMVTLRDAIKETERQLRVSGETALKRLRARREAIDIQLGALREVSDRWEKELALTASERVTYENLTSKLERLRSLSEEVSSRVIDNAARVADPHFVHTVSSPQHVKDFVYPNRPFIVGTSAAGGFALALALILLLDFSRAFPHHDMQQIQYGLQIPFLGILPDWKKHTRKKQISDYRLVTKQDKSSNAATLYRQLRIALDEKLGMTNPYSLLVASPSKSDGKTTTAVNLALAYSWVRRKVLIVDDALAEPHLHEAFRIQPTSGLVDVLTGAVTDWHQVVYRTAEEGIDMIPGGAYIPASNDQFKAREFRELVEAWNREYNIVIIDTDPTAGRITNTSFIDACTGILLVVRPHGSRFLDALHTVETFESGNIVGFCANRFRVTTQLRTCPNPVCRTGVLCPFAHFKKCRHHSV